MDAATQFQQMIANNPGGQSMLSPMGMLQQPPQVRAVKQKSPRHGFMRPATVYLFRWAWSETCVTDGSVQLMGWKYFNFR